MLRCFPSLCSHLTPHRIDFLTLIFVFAYLQKKIFFFAFCLICCCVIFNGGVATITHSKIKIFSSKLAKLFKYSNAKVRKLKLASCRGALWGGVQQQAFECVYIMAFSSLLLTQTYYFALDNQSYFLFSLVCQKKKQK